MYLPTQKFIHAERGDEGPAGILAEMLVVLIVSVLLAYIGGGVVMWFLLEAGLVQEVHRLDVVAARPVVFMLLITFYSVGRLALGGRRMLVTVLVFCWIAMLVGLALNVGPILRLLGLGSEG